MATRRPRRTRGLCLLLLCSAGIAAAASPRGLLLDGALAGDAVVAVGERGTILRSTDQARTWQPATLATPVTATLTGVSFAPDARHGWAVGHDALILVTSDGGATWQQQWQEENLSDSLLDVLAVDETTIFAVGAYGLFLESLDAGQSWHRRKIGDDDFHFNRITRGPTGTLYLAGERGTLLRSSDRGVAWERIDSPYDGSFYGILPLGPAQLLAYGLRGRIYRSDDDGRTWQLVPTHQRGLLATAARTKTGSIVFAGQSRALLASADHGASVTEWSAPLTTAVAELVPLPDGSVLALGEAGATVLPTP